MDYKEKLRLAKEALDSGSYDKETIEYIFPELAESGGEQHRKWILEYLYDGLRKSDEQFKDQFKAAIAWFEKQGEQKHTAEEVLIKAGLKPYKDGDQWCVLLGDNIQEGICGFGNTIEDALYAFLKDLIASQDKQKSVKVPKFKAGDIIRHKKQGFTCKIIAVDTEAEEYKLSECNGTHIPFYFQDAYELVERKSAEVEPRFKVGDWVVFNDKHESVYQIKKIENFQYTLRHILGGSMPLSFSHEDMIRAWTINDAKDGDVLVNKYGDVMLFKGITDDRHICGYCQYSTEDRKLYNECSDFSNYYPATQEQRDTLMKAMADAGYTFDFEKKELKKIEQKPIFDVEIPFGTDSELIEEAITIPDGCYAIIEDNKVILRKGEKKPAEWSEEDEKMLNEIKVAINSYYAPWLTETEKKISWIKNRLKSLRPQSTWRPSEEMLEALYRAIPENTMEISEDEMLLDKLYQGLKYGRVLSKK